MQRNVFVVTCYNMENAKMKLSDIHGKVFGISCNNGYHIY